MRKTGALWRRRRTVCFKAITMEPWWHEFVELRAAGLLGKAIALARRQQRQGSLATKVQLACLGEKAGISREMADFMLAEVEEIVRSNDITAHWALYGACEVGLGKLEYDERSRLDLRHLEIYAMEAQDPQAMYAVALNYSTGRIGVLRDDALAVEWMHYAAALGHERACRAVRADA